jgi:hypothetical protein
MTEKERLHDIYTDIWDTAGDLQGAASELQLRVERDLKEAPGLIRTVRRANRLAEELEFALEAIASIAENKVNDYYG